ncbi:type IV pilus assembly protein PilC [Lacibacter cauensis]|uniref:General secretion pathway protein F n=1 Tax=Lacibacter cauensis TaxID=510947 RepID=A0A562SWR0_9BACT|nr:type II secretion system F family protein [Lacibacter cauensis]TWI85737.1 type IV pilus assembly protein PilC [Lacibacter cauensis]
MNIDVRKLNRKIDTESNEKKSSADASAFWSFLSRDISFTRTAITDKVKENFYLELSALMEAGVDINNSMVIIINEIKDKKIKKVLEELHANIIAGATLSQAMRKERSFTSYEFFSIQIGEETGRLIDIFKQLSLFFESKVKQRRQVLNAISYPIFILFVSFCAIFFMVNYVVPLFADIFKRFGSDLPTLTKAVLKFSILFKKFAYVILLIVVFSILFYYNQRNKNWYRRMSSAFLIRLPVIGRLLQKIYLTRFAHTMSLLLSSDIPMLQALELTRKMISFYPIETSLQVIEQSVLVGDSLNKSMELHSVFPRKMISMIKVGEEVNQLSLFFDKIALQFSREVDHLSSLLGKLIEPVVIIILGVITGVILIALYLPLFKFGQTLQ